MEIRFLEKSKNGMKISFLVRGITPYFANTIRRARNDVTPLTTRTVTIIIPIGAILIPVK